MEISAKQVAELRKATGAGLMECKKALKECDGDLEKSKDYLRKRGLEVAAKKSARSTDNGWIGQYVHHNGRVGVLLELRCETDFVAKQEVFQTLLDDLCKHIAVTNPVAIDRDGVPADVVEREKEIFKAQVPPGKPDEIVEKIISGKVDSFYKERCLLEQPFIKETKLSIKDLISAAVQKTGENITVARFERFELGED